MRSAHPDYWARRRTPAHTEFRRARDLLLSLRNDQDAAVDRFRWPRPAEFNWALEWFDVIAHGNHDPALVLIRPDGTADQVTFARMSAESDRTAGWFTALGVRRGDRVLVALDARRELWEVILACLKTGAVVVPTHCGLTRREAADRVRRGAISHVVCRDGDAPLFDGVALPGRRIGVGGAAVREGWVRYEDRADEGPFLPGEATAADALAFCYFTSGTTSAPKLVGHTHTSYPVGHLSSMYFNGLVPGDRHLNVSVPGWAKHSWSSFFVPWNAEATVVVPPDGPVGELPLADWLLAHRVTSMCAPPSVWRALSQRPDGVRPALREATSAGEPLDAELARRVRAAWNVPLRDGYGQTEATALIGTSPGLPHRPGLLGKPLPGYRITLRSEDGTTGARRGEICVDLAQAPAGMMQGYLEAGKEARPPGQDGLYPTGDLGERDESGYLRVLGRLDDVFKSAGHRVSPHEVEAAVNAHAAVAASAVVPVPHPAGGAAPHAVVVPRADHPAGPELARTLLAHCQDLLPAHARPYSVSFTTDLPRTVSGKIRRRQVAAQLQEKEAL
ncbi:AMP-binding protein [Streptomyces sp. NPDC017056]|uniref:AMP-binding protein n=1 Tax=Streptomyces sp. NPDC017056 TaxID=3364973 RepID=UPI0037B81DFA